MTPRPPNVRLPPWSLRVAIQPEATMSPCVPRLLRTCVTHSGKESVGDCRWCAGAPGARVRWGGSRHVVDRLLRLARARRFLAEGLTFATLSPEKVRPI